MNNWDIKFIELSRHVAQWSKDTNKKVGAIIVNEDNIVLASGCNGFPRGINDKINSRYEKPDKYLFTAHAEANAIFHAARLGVSIKDCRMYVTMFPCSSCAIAIIQSGIKHIITPSPDVQHEKWGIHFKASLAMLEEANIEITLID